jgi:probable F420-dependent oxidoreductase
MRYIYQYPEVQGTDINMLDTGDVAELAVAVEAAGWDGFGFTEHPAPSARWLATGGHQSIDPLIGLSHAAAVTSRIRLLTYLAVVPYRNPLLLAKAAASVDLLSKGRLILGAGTGYLKSEFFALGVDFDERNDLFDEALDVMPLHWKGEPFSYQGRHFGARDIMARPKPIQDPIPIWVGGNSRSTLKRVATKAQGWMPLMGSRQLVTTARTAYLASLEDVTAKVRDLRVMAGPRGDGLDIALAYHDDAIWQPDVEADRHREGLAALEQAGASWILVEGPPGSSKASLEFIEAFPRIYKQ